MSPNNTYRYWKQTNSNFPDPIILGMNPTLGAGGTQYMDLPQRSTGNYYILTDPGGSASDSSERTQQIDLLIDSRFNLKKPILVQLRNHGLEVIGTIDDLELYSFGRNADEVLRELNGEVTELFQMLEGMEEENLGRYPTKWKSILNDYLEVS